MDGSSGVGVMTLGDIIETGMRRGIKFAVIREQVAKFLKQQGCYGLGTERVGEKTYVIVVHYWDRAGQHQSEDFDEWPSYTKRYRSDSW